MKGLYSSQYSDTLNPRGSIHIRTSDAMRRAPLDPDAISWSAGGMNVSSTLADKEKLAVAARSQMALILDRLAPT